METSHWRGVFKKPKILVLSQCFFSKIDLEIYLIYKCIKIWSQLTKHLPQWQIQGGGGLGGLCPPFRIIFLFYKSEVYWQKLVLNEYEICLKMLEMVILETQIFKFFWGGHTPRPP